MARGRSEGIPPLNVARARFFALTQDAAVEPYANWSEFRFGLRHDESFANFLAAYGTDPRITGETTLGEGGPRRRRLWRPIRPIRSCSKPLR
jgi:hypothetical protein